MLGYISSSLFNQPDDPQLKQIELTKLQNNDSEISEIFFDRMSKEEVTLLSQALIANTHLKSLKIGLLEMGKLSELSEA